MASRQRRRASVSPLWSGPPISTGEPVSAASSRARFVALFDGGTRTVPCRYRAGGNARKSDTVLQRDERGRPVVGDLHPPPLLDERGQDLDAPAAHALGPRPVEM